MKNIIKKLIKPLSILVLLGLFFLPALEKSLMYWKLSSAFYQLKKEVGQFKVDSVLKSEGFVMRFLDGENEKVALYKLTNEGPCSAESVGEIVKTLPLVDSPFGNFSVKAEKEIIFCFFPDKNAEVSGEMNTEFYLRILSESFFRDNNPADLRFHIDLENFDLRS